VDPPTARPTAVALTSGPDGVGELLPLGAAGVPTGPAYSVPDLAAAVAEAEQEGGPRWILPDVAATYPGLVRAGVRIGRCHDVASTQALLLAAEGDHAAAAAVTAARAGAAEVAAGQPALFEPGPATPPMTAQDVADAYAGQLDRITRRRAELPGLGLLVAAESASCLAAVEMTHAGLPWSADVHDRLLTELLGARPAAASARPPVLQALAEEVAEILGEPGLNVDSQADVLRALRRAGLPVTSTRRHELRRHEHRVVEPFVRYRELARLHAAHGWAWREQWVRDGRFHPEYVPGGVVSGRWATRGGGALQIPKAVRAAVVAPPGRLLVVADAGQLEPRVLAALARDPGLVAATTEGDLYAALAREALGRPEARREMKVALLSAMYGGGAGSPALAALRRRFPAALALLEDAARTGEVGGSVRSVLGRTSPPPRPDWLSGLSDAAAAARSRAWGRFTRNFVVQASAADWASVLIASLRQRLAGLDGQAELVFFQHDEVVVEAEEPVAADAVGCVAEAGAAATSLVLGDVGVHVPLDGRVVRTYADR
jgi:DNA polymerase-1